MHYQLLIIGSGSDAATAARSAAEQGQRVALIDTTSGDRDGVTIDLLADAVERVIENGTVSMSAVRDEVTRSIHCRRSADRAELDSLGVEQFSGSVQLLNTTTVEVGREQTVLTANSIVLACGTKSAECWHLPLNNRSVIHAESLLDLDELPQSMVVVGAGRTGLEHAILLARLGVDVTVVDEHSSPLELCGHLMDDTRLFEAQSLDVTFRLGDEVIGVQGCPDGRVNARLASGKGLTSDVVMICVAREGRTTGLGLEAAGVGLDERGRIWCDAAGQTWTPNIRAIGDVVGFRSQATHKFDRLVHVRG